MAVKRVMVTGGSGFIGSNLCRVLLEAEVEVICIDNFYSSQPYTIKSLKKHPGFTFIEQDITETIPNVTVDEIYHLACPASPKYYQKDPVQTLKTCFLGTLNVLEFAKKENIKVLLSSTSEVYGDPQVHPQPENYWGNVNPTGVRSCYDEGKRCAEALFFDFHRTFNLPIKVARIFNTYGPNMSRNDGRVISNFITQAIEGKSITVYGDGKQTRSFCFIDDLIKGLMALMATEYAFVGPVNLGNPQEISMLELAILISHMMQQKEHIEFKPLPQDDPRVRQPDITLAKQALNWEPRTNLNEGLYHTCTYFKEMYRANVLS